MKRSRIKSSKGLASNLLIWALAWALGSSVSAQLNEEVGRLVQAVGEVTIVTNDGNEIKAASVLSSADEGGVPIKFGNKIITSEYSSAVILTSDENVHHLREMTSIQFGVASRPRERGTSSVLERVVSFFTRQSGKEGDYRTDIVNTGWDDISMNAEPGGNGDA